MKSPIASAALATLLAGPALAGGPVVVPADPVPMEPAPVSIYDWSGFYSGLTFGTASGDARLSPGSSGDLEDGTIAGVYGGYLWQRGAFVYGGELAYGDLNDATLDGFEGFDTAIDLKARLGYAADRFLVYGVVGYSQAQFVYDGDEWDTDGMSYGIGAEYALNDRFVVGVEYLNRDLEGDEPSPLGVEAEGNLNTLGLRMSLSF